jgi:hypothetical protein
MMLVCGHGFSAEEREEYKTIVFENTISCMQVLLKELDKGHCLGGCIPVFKGESAMTAQPACRRAKAKMRAFGADSNNIKCIIRANNIHLVLLKKYIPHFLFAKQRKHRNQTSTTKSYNKMHSTLCSCHIINSLILGKHS